MLHRRLYQAAPAPEMGCFGWLMLLFFLGFVVFHAAKFALVLCIVFSH
jgi:hypothetical protein